MANDTYLPAATEHVAVPEDALMDARLTDTDPGEILMELDMVGTDNRRVVLAMSGTVAEVRAHLDTIRAALARADHLLRDREVVAEYGLGGF